MLTDGFYWDQNDEARTFGKRFFEQLKKMPSMIQAGVYSSRMTYLKAVQAAGTDEPDAVMEKMKETKINDLFAKNGYIRADGRMVHDLYLMQVKKPAESKYPWDYYYGARRRYPPSEAFTAARQASVRRARSKPVERRARSTCRQHDRSGG